MNITHKVCLALTSFMLAACTGGPAQPSSSVAVSSQSSSQPSVSSLSASSVALVSSQASSEPASSSAAQSSSQAGAIVYAINVGGPALLSASGTQFIADNPAWVTGGTARIDDESVQAVDALLYQSERWGQFTYRLPIAAGRYDVIVKLAETSWAVGNLDQRVMSVLIEGTPLREDFVVGELAGGRLKPLDLELENIPVTDGELTLSFSASLDNATVSAIVVTTPDGQSVPALNSSSSSANNMSAASSIAGNSSSKSNSSVQTSSQESSSQNSSANQSSSQMTASSAAPDGQYTANYARRTLAGGLTIYPAPEGRAASKKFSIQVQNNNGVWKDVYVYQANARPDGSGADAQAGRTFNYTTFETNKARKIRVKRLAGSAGAVTLKPLRHGLTAATNGDTTEFTMEPGMKISVEYASGSEGKYPYNFKRVTDILMIFADKPGYDVLAGISSADIYRVPVGDHQKNNGWESNLGNVGGKRVVVFEPGVYDIGYWAVPNNIEHIHVAGGAVVYGAIDIQPKGGANPNDYQNKWQQFNLRDRVVISGHGVISGSKIPWHTDKFGVFDQADIWYRMIKLVQIAAREFELLDVTIEDSPHWTVSFANDDDARTQGLMENFKLVAAWTYNNDGTPLPQGSVNRRSVVKDCFVHANDDAFKLYNSHVTIDNCQVWQSKNGAVFQLGWFPKTVEDIEVSNVDLLNIELWYNQGHNLGLVNFTSGNGSGVIKNIAFNNINVDTNIARVIGLKANTQQFRDITFNNLYVNAMDSDPAGSGVFNWLEGDINGVTFNHFCVGGDVVTNMSDAKISAAGNVSNIEFIGSGRCERNR